MPNGDLLMGRLASPKIEAEKNTEAALAFESFARRLEARPAVDHQAA